jgi:hypothetical protein
VMMLVLMDKEDVGVGDIFYCYFYFSKSLRTSFICSKV